MGALSHVAGRTGKNFALTAAETFGRKGAAIAAGFLSTVVIGWFAFQTGLTGATLNSSLGWNEPAMIALAGVLYVGVTFIGIRALTVIGLVAAPLFVVLAVVALVYAARDGGMSGITSFQGGGPDAGVLSVGAAITIVIAGFADSGTMTADFTRWSRNGREAVLATFTAFPLANFISAAGRRPHRGRRRGRHPRHRRRRLPAHPHLPRLGALGAGRGVRLHQPGLGLHPLPLQRRRRLEPAHRGPDARPHPRPRRHRPGGRAGGGVEPLRRPG